jgi:hypothetical protein
MSLIFFTFSMLCSLLFISNCCVSAVFEDIKVGNNIANERHEQREAAQAQATVVSGHWVLENTQSKHPIGSYHKWYETAISDEQNSFDFVVFAQHTLYCNSTFFLSSIFVVLNFFLLFALQVEKFIIYKCKSYILHRQ